MLLRHIYLHALGQVLHAKLSYQLIGDIAGHGIHTIYLSRCQACNNGYDFIRDAHLTHHLFFI